MLAVFRWSCNSSFLQLSHRWTYLQNLWGTVYCMLQALWGWSLQSSKCLSSKSRHQTEKGWTGVELRVRTELTQSFHSLLPSGTSEERCSFSHYKQLIQPTFCENQWKWLGDRNIPIPYVAPHPRHAHKLVSRRWKRMRASSIETEIRDFSLLTGSSAQEPRCRWCSIWENWKRCPHSPAGQRKHTDVLLAGSEGHHLTYFKDNKPFEKASYVTFYLQFINAFPVNVLQALCSLDLNPVWSTTNYAEVWFILKVRKWPNYRQISFVISWRTQETSV